MHFHKTKIAYIRAVYSTKTVFEIPHKVWYVKQKFN